MTSIRPQRPGTDRRTLLSALGATGVAAGFGTAFGTGGGTASGTPSGAGAARAVPAQRRPAAPDVATAAAASTLATAAAPRGTGSYRRLAEGPGWGRVVREDLASARRSRTGTRTVLASFVQLTDLHVVDVQHPLRTEYIRFARIRGWRPQEALSVVGAVSLIEQVNAMGAGPATGAPLEFAMTTGDNTDNNCTAELEWFLTAMSGGRITPDTGDPQGYEGVQSSGLPVFWHPDSGLRDSHKDLGFPRLDGYLDAARRQVRSPGLNIPWYGTVGNHDVLPGGCYANGDDFLTEFAVGDRKLFEVSPAEGMALWKRIRHGLDPAADLYKDLLRAHARDMRTVTPDPGRAPFTPRDYVRAHLEPRFTGPGPVGHGYSEANVEEDRLYYSFRISDEVLGISLDTTRRGGHYVGAIGRTQLRWLERTLREHRDDKVLVFSHHTSQSTPDGGAELVELLRRHPQVLAWINGHSHRNEIIPHGTFWEVNTASHIDFPQVARAIEVTDNGDGTLSLFTTLIESAAPHRTDHDDLSRAGLASLYRELAFNAPERRSKAGEPGDRNTELLLRV